MKSIDIFEDVWLRADCLAALHGYVAANGSPILRPDELLRAEWAARVSALDLYFHELVAQGMLEIFEGRRASCAKYLNFKLSNKTLQRIMGAQNSAEASLAFDFDVRSQLSLMSFQDPVKIAEGVRMFSDIELWNELVVSLGSSPASTVRDAKKIKIDLSNMVQRRHKIVHEGDLRSDFPRAPWDICRRDVDDVRELIDKVVRGVDKLLA